jgi:hypothetical protein
MTPKLTDEQRLAVEEHGGRPVPVVDPQSQHVFYLVSGEQLRLIRSLLEDEPFDVRETYAAQDTALRQVWDDPALDVYNESPEGETQ